MKEQNILVLLGAQGSGKSTFKQTWLRANSHYAAVSRDDIRAMFYGRDKNTLLTPRQEQEVTVAHEALIKVLISQGRSVLADNTHTSAKYIKAYSQFGVPVKYHYLDTPLVECIKRNMLRPSNERIPTEVVQKAYENLQRLRESPYWDEVIAPNMLGNEDFKMTERFLPPKSLPPQLNLEELDQLVSEGLLHMQTHPTSGWRIYNYTEKVQYNGLWTPLLRQMRALVVDTDGWIQARSFGKFHNAEEIGFVFLPQDEPVRFDDKIDGSFIQTIWPNGDLDVTSKGSFMSPHAEKARELLKTKYAEAAETLTPGITYTFELIFPEGRIVCDYGDEEKLVLTGIFHPHTYNEYDRVDSMFAPKGFELPETVYADSLGDLAAHQAVNTYNKEGHVIYFPRLGARIKLKFPTYVHLHRIISSLTSVRVWEELSMNNGEITEAFLKTVPDEYHKWLHEVEADLCHQVEQQYTQATRIFQQIESLGQCDRKTYAMAILQHSEELRPLLFGLLDGKDIIPYIWKRIKPQPLRPNGALLLN